MLCYHVLIVVRTASIIVRTGLIRTASLQQDILVVLTASLDVLIVRTVSLYKDIVIGTAFQQDRMHLQNLKIKHKKDNYPSPKLHMPLLPN